MIARAMDTVRELVPDLDSRISQFEVEAFELDDDLLEAFCEELERIGGDVQAGLDESDNEKIRVAAHSFKGMCGTMGLPEISVLAQEIELTLPNDQSRCNQLCGLLVHWALDFIAASK